MVQMVNSVLFGIWNIERAFPNAAWSKDQNGIIDGLSIIKGQITIFVALFCGN